MEHFISTSCVGERCQICGAPATHKVGEEIPHDDPLPARHNLTAYVCCRHFKTLLGPAVSCGGKNEIQPETLPKGYFGPTPSGRC
jgi:hypothetical protein